MSLEKILQEISQEVKEEDKKKRYAGTNHII